MACKLFLLFMLPACFAFMSSISLAHEFIVGGVKGWSKPTGNETEPYDEWAMRNRFHIGDSLYFKYENDSVLVVDRDDYKHCNTTRPVHEFTDGNTTFRFDRFGYFSFISGEPGHCELGQKLIVRVMVHPEVMSPGPSPAGQVDDGRSSGSGPSSQTESNASPELAAAAGSYSVIMAAFGAVLIKLLLV